nr:RNA 2'-phosphotransferase [Deinococcus yavapaiensis]
MDDRARVRLSKTLARFLRHAPHELGLTLQLGGWVDVEALLTALGERGQYVSRTDLEEVVRSSDKRRFSFDAPKARIRANQGHSVEVDLQLAPIEPPAVLYHGTSADKVDVILREGLRAMRRHHVHLSADEETARRVGARHGRAVVLTVDAARMHADGRVFYRSENGVWLADDVPSAYLRRSS